MTAYTQVRIECDHRGCYKPFEPDPDPGYLTLAPLRRGARKAGWTLVRNSLGRRFDKDYCPEHSGGTERDSDRG